MMAAVSFWRRLPVPTVPSSIPRPPSSTLYAARTLRTLASAACPPPALRTVTHFCNLSPLCATTSWCPTPSSMGWFCKLWWCAVGVVVGTKDLPICIALSSHCHRNRKKANAPVILADIIYIDVHRLGVTSTNPLSSGSVHIYAPPPSPPPTCTPPAAPCSIFTAASAWHGTAGAARASDLLLKGRGTRVSHRANVGGCAAMTMLSDSNLKCHIRVFP
jgi:hypothetical protein